MAMMAFSTVKVFSVTLGARHELGERVAEWLKRRPGVHARRPRRQPVSDHEFHCLSVTLFLAGEVAAAESRRRSAHHRPDR